MSAGSRKLISHWLDGLLRGQSADVRERQLPLRGLLCVIIACGCTYGAVMGCFSGRPLQMLYSASKVPLLFGVTFVVSLPAFFVLNTLVGLRDDFFRVIKALAATQAGVSVILMSFAPLTLMWYASFANYAAAVAFNTVAFGVASATGQILLLRFYRELIESNPLHKTMLRVWLLVFAFVGIQAGWMLRPFIGNPNSPPVFVRTGEWTNAYVAVFRLFAGIVFG